MPLAAKLWVQVGGDTKEADQALDALNKRILDQGKKLENAGKALSLTVTAPLVLLGKQSVGLAAKYSEAMNILQATSKASGAEMAALDTMAKDLGADLTLPATSASDAAEAMVELAKSGLDVKQVMGASRGVLQLAAAGNLSNARAAEIASNALNMFNLRGSETVRVADLLAAGANVSSAEVEDMGASLQMAGSVFAAAGVPIEDLATAIAEMANSGIKGSDAGTSLKQMLLSLQAPSDKAAELMQDLGIKVYDAQGSLLPFNSLVREFESNLTGLTQEQRNQALATIFGSDAVRAANVVLMGGADKFDEYKEKVTDAGAAADLAASRTHGLSGKIEGMQTAMETAGLALADAAEGLVMKLLDGITNAANAFSNLDKEQQTTLTNIAIGLAALGPGLIIVGKLATAFVTVTTFAKTAGVALAGMAAKANISLMMSGMGGLAGIAGPAAIFVGALTAVGIAYKVFVADINKAGSDAVSGAWAEFWDKQVTSGKSAVEVLQAYKEKQEGVTKTLEDAGIARIFIANQKELINNTEGLNQALATTSQTYRGYVNLVNEAGAGIAPMTQSAWEMTRSIYGVNEANNAATTQMQQLDEALESNVAYYNQVTEAAGKFGQTQIESNEEILRGAEATKGGLEEMVAQYDTLKDKMDSWLQETAGQVVSMLGDRFSEASLKYRDALAEVDLIMGTNYTKQLEQKDAVKNLVDQYARSGNLDAFKTGLTKIKDEGLADMQTQLEDVTTKAQLLYDKLLALPQEIKIKISFNAGGIPGWVSQNPTPQMTYTNWNASLAAGEDTEGRASGGPVMAGRPYVVGERGIPEIFVPDQSGTIIPTDRMAGGVVIENMVIQSAAQNGRQLFEEFKNELDAWIRRERAAGRQYAGQ